MPKREFKDMNGYVDEWRSIWEPDLEAIAYNGATCDPTKVDPKVLQWVREHCDVAKPRFVKVLSETASHGCHKNGKAQYMINVPRPFVREHYRELGRVVTLEHGASHKKWKVSFGSPKKCSSWLQGWRRVAVENHLQPGDVMIFVLVAPSHFHFHLFDEDGNTPEANRRKTSQVKTEYVEGQVHKLKKMRRLFDPDLPIVKTEPGFFQRNVISPEDHAPIVGSDPGFFQRNVISPEDHAPIVEPVQPEELEVLRTVSSDSELTVTDGEEAIEDKNGAANTISGQSDEVCGLVDELVKQRLEFHAETVAKDFLGGESGLVSNLTVSLQVAPELRFNPLEYLVESKRRATTPAERKRARDTAVAYAKSLVGCDGFVAFMSETKVYKDFHLPLPEQFVLDARFPSTLTKVKLVDWDGGPSSSKKKTWEVYSRLNSCNEVSFHRKHWAVFALEHFLEDGDVCVFELMSKGTTFTISVRVFRVLELVERPGSVWDHYRLRPKPKKPST